jgi:hypothetical protein
MKRPPSNPEFARFTDAMRGIMKVSKTELNARIAETKKGKPEPSASPASPASPSPASPSKSAD